MFELRTFGGLELLRNGDRDASAIPIQAKRLALLACLAALPPGTFRRRDTLLLLFWPDLDQEHARGSLRQALHSLRKTLGEGTILTRGEDEIGLDAVELHSDARALEAAVAAGDPGKAMALYRGDFLEGVFVTDASPDLEDWISAERTRLRGLAAKAAWMASELPVNRDNAGELVRRAVHWSGDDEAALRHGLRVLDGMGDRAGAAALYDEFARRVARDLDVQLSRETRELIRGLRARRDSGGADRVVSLEQVSAGPNVSPEPPPGETAREPNSLTMMSRRPGKRLLLAGIAGALLVMAVAAKVGPGRAAASRAWSGGIEVMPFRVSEADSTLAWLGDGMVELLTARLAGAAGAGAGRVVEGRVTGTSQHLILSASLSSSGDSTMPTRAVAEGPADSLPALADRLAGQLLGIAAGLEGAQLASLTSASLPAIRLFLAGQAAYRKGRMETAIQLFSEAIALDSTFALAGLQHMRAVVWAGPGTRWLSDRGRRAALAGRDRLSPADRALLDASPGEWKSAPDMFAGLNAAVRAFPQQPEAWYALGDAHFHWGALYGEERWAERAADAFRRGWLRDSAAGARAMGKPPVAPPMQHLVELAHMRHDTAEVIRLASSVLAADSTSDLARQVTWHRALVTSDSAREAFWKEAGGASQQVTMHIVLFIHWTGIGVVDRDRARREDQDRLRAHDPGYASWAFTIYALNTGRPGDIPLAGPTQGFAANKLHRDRIRQALSWDGDTNVALESVRILSRSAAAPASGEGARQQLFDACAVGEWQASRADYAAAARAITRLRRARVDQLRPADAGETARYVSLCAALLEAMRASGLRLPEARERVAAADSVARDFIQAICCGERLGDANIQIARLWEQEGDLPAALRAVARGATPSFVGPAYRSTLLREEGRLAALTGDTARAVSAYRKYLAFRPHPQPSLKPGVDSVRRELAALEGS